MSLFGYPGGSKLMAGRAFTAGSVNLLLPNPIVAAHTDLRGRIVGFCFSFDSFECRKRMTVRTVGPEAVLNGHEIDGSYLAIGFVALGTI